jgi:WD40 repeat protein
VVTGRQSTRHDKHTEEINCIAISPDGTTVASAAVDRQLYLWRIADDTAQPLGTRSTNVSILLFSHDGKQLWCGVTTAT